MSNSKKISSHFSNKKILITGNTGFKGSWLSIFLKSLDSHVYGLSDKPYDGIFKLANVSDVLVDQKYIDLNKITEDELAKTLSEISPEIIFHFSAQSLVPIAIKKPLETLSTNIIGTYKILQAANKCESANTITIATTDKVYKYPSNDNKEDDHLGSFEYYSASKVGQESVVDAFINVEKRQNLNVTKVRSGNVIGGGDRAESRLMTDLINAGHNKNTINLRNPLSIRPWTYILDSLYGYIQATNYSYTEAKSEIFNLNSELDNEYTVEYITKKYCELSNNAFDVEVTPNELKEVNELRINSQKAINQLGWRAIIGVDNALEKIKNWENFYRNSSDINYSFDEVSDYLKELDE